MNIADKWWIKEAQAMRDRLLFEISKGDLGSTDTPLIPASTSM